MTLPGSRTAFTTCDDDRMMSYPYPTSFCDSGSGNWTYPSSQYRRPCGPIQPVPRSAHTPSASISSIFTAFSSSNCTHSRNRSDFSATTIGKGVDAQAVIAKILQRDQYHGSSYLASCQEKRSGQKCGANGRSVPEGDDKKRKDPSCSFETRCEPPACPDSRRRALLSMANGVKAPILLRGPSHRSRDGNEGRTAAPASSATPESAAPSTIDTPPIPRRSPAVQYMHRRLPPTPSLSNPSATLDATFPSPSPPLPKAGPVPFCSERSKANASPQTSPLQPRLANDRRQSRTGGPIGPSRRFRAIPAPIRPPPRFQGPPACNGPSSAHTTDEDEEMLLEEGDIEELELGERLLTDEAKAKAVSTPMGELPITPLDIPVDWDDLHDRWTSPILVHPEETEAKEGPERDALMAFHEDVGKLFARTPSIQVGEDDDDEESFTAQRTERLVEGNTESVPASDSEGQEAKREKRHGKVLVKKELKLSLKVANGPKAGESFLMMNSPLSAQ